MLPSLLPLALALALPLPLALPRCYHLYCSDTVLDEQPEAEVPRASLAYLTLAPTLALALSLALA